MPSKLLIVLSMMDSELPMLGGYWSDETRRRELFVQYAKDNHFDPLLPHSWYNISFEQLQEHKVCSRALVLILHNKTQQTKLQGFNTVVGTFYNDSLTTALVQLFPEVPFELSKFRVTSSVFE